MSNQGLVKKLLFPGFTDAGANDTFLPQEDASANVSQEEIANTSDATTAILDNRTTTKSVMKKTLDASGLAKDPPTRYTLNDSLITETGSVTPVPRAKFFPSTDPKVQKPSSSSRTTTRVGGTISSPFPTTSPRPNLSTTVFMDATVEKSNVSHDDSSKTSSVVVDQTTTETNETGQDGVVIDGGTPVIDNQTLWAISGASSSAIRDKRDDNSDSASDADSNASEMGTVINAAAKLEEVSLMANYMTPTPIVEEDESNLDATEVAGLSLPMLENSKPSNHDRDAAAVAGESPGGYSGLVSAAFRRIGNGVGSLNRSGAQSAPSTPRIEDYLRSAYRSRNERSSSLSGTDAVQPPSPGPFRLGSSSKGPETRDENSILKHANSLASPLLFGRGCLSFDNTKDTHRSVRADLAIPDDLKQVQSERMGLRFRPLSQSKSWDVATRTVIPIKTETVRGDRDPSSAFRPVSQRRGTRKESVRSPVVGKTHVSNMLSPQIHNSRDAIALGTPHRVDLEREDALDILGCFVGRSIDFVEELKQVERQSNVQRKHSGDESHVSIGLEDDGVSTVAEIGQTEMAASSLGTEKLSLEDIQRAIETLRQLSADCEGDEDAHSFRMKAMDELMLSLNYASEMQRAALSASAWLQSIGRHAAAHKVPAIREENQSFDQPAGEEQQPSQSHFDNEAELLVLRARVHSLEKKLNGRDDLISRLNDELSKCRAEIGRMKCSSRSEVLFSPNRSVLDNDDSDVSDTASGEAESIDVLADVLGATSPIPTDEECRLDVDGSFARSDTVLQTSGKPTGALADPVNGKLPKQKGNGEKDEPDHRTIHVKMLDGENFTTAWESLVQLAPPPDHDLRSPIVHDLLQQWTSDSSMHESFLAWMERAIEGVDPLDLPPLTVSSLNHQVRDGLAMHVLPLLLRRSDIFVNVKTRAHRRTSYDMSVVINRNDDVGVGTPLEQRATQSQMMAFKASRAEGHALGVSMQVDDEDNTTSWYKHSIDRAQNGHAALNNLGVERMPPGETILPRFRKLVYPTDTGLPIARRPDPLEDESSVQSNFGSQRGSQASLMGAIGSFGGFLNRKKATTAQFGDMADSQVSSPIGLEPHSPKFASGEDEDEEGQPYHRVVSAPPGRIGITFVQYRGHAMVSDVAADSPLSGFVHPSDILIAIDEVTVSGMRVRDIVKLLTTRKGHQRALRVVSSHAMNDFHINMSSLMDQP